MQLHEKIFELALKRSFFFPSYEPYGGTAGFYDYGPVGVLIKHKIERLWRKMFIKSEGFHEVETSTVTPEPVLVASGHVESFGDPVVECTKCGTKVRADTFVEDVHYRMHGEKWDGRLDSLDQTIRDGEIKCPRCGGLFGPAYMFNLMFKTGIGGDLAPAYTRPETAQGIFTAFPRLFRNHGTRLPMAIGQIGRSYRNEISPRKGLVRMREFTQMELEYFFDPESGGYEGFRDVEKQKMTMALDSKKEEMSAGELVEKKIASNQIMSFFLAREWEFYKKVGIPEDRMYFRVLGENEMPHYSKANIDMEVESSFGVVETIGNAYRTDFDLSQHAKTSGKDLSVHVEGRKIIPHVVEVSMGVDRLFFCILEHCYREKTKEKDWEWFDFPPVIAPYHAAVFPLMRKDGLDKKAKELTGMLREKGFDIAYRSSGSIGRRYARGDEIGIPFAFTVDYDTLKDDTVTIRYRNDGGQERIKIADCDSVLRKNIQEGKVTL
ncbi:glycine--tRNA ligase [Candidatus Micrarchaeota archaeon]|nr:glycine--tRNA ligase [Candidatus Micrarchaeota archaeon]